MNMCFYAPIKNESRYLKKFIEHHLKEMKHEDCFIFCDTGSTDNTIDILKELKEKHSNITYYTNTDIIPWDFSKGRNTIQDKIPDNIQVCCALDIDEFFKSGWRNKLENIYNKEKHFVLSFKRTEDCSEEKPGFFFIQPRCSIHTKDDAKWVYPVHECLIPINTTVKHIPEMTIESVHYRNGNTKRNYLKIISDYKEYIDERNAEDITFCAFNEINYFHLQYLYANELFFAKEFDKAIYEYHQYFNLIGSIDTNKHDTEFRRNLTRCYTRIGYIYTCKKDFHNALIYKGFAVALWPCRETYLSLCIIHSQLGNIYEAQKYFELGLNCNQSESYEIMSNYWNLEWLEQLKAIINNQQ